MISFVDHPSGDMINSVDLYNNLGLNASHYDRWMDDNLLQLSELEIDYFKMALKREGKGRPRQEYLITLEFTKTLCALAKTNKALDLRRWLINYQIEQDLQK
jgi:phage anti-repressor protein